MIGVAIAAALAQPNWPVGDLRADLVALHETTRRAHLLGDATLIAAGAADQILMADGGAARVQSNAELTQFFATYFKRVRYREWRDVSRPVIEISPDGQMAWMAVELVAQHTQTDAPESAPTTFKSGWIATYQRTACTWRMTGMASNVVR